MLEKQEFLVKNKRIDNCICRCLRVLVRMMKLASLKTDSKVIEGLLEENRELFKKYRKELLKECIFK